MPFKFGRKQDKSAAPDASESTSSAAPGSENPEPPSCPYCCEQLEKMPSRKKKCPNCGQPIHIVTLPATRERVLAREEDLPFIGVGWTFERALDEGLLYTRADLDSARSELAARFGSPPSESDVRWAVFNRKIVEYAEVGHWAKYTSIRYNMGEQLFAEKRFEPALDTYLEVTYLELNGARDKGLKVDPDLGPGARLFDPDLGFVPPTVVGRLGQCAHFLGRSLGDSRARFVELAHKQQERLPLTLDPEVAWQTLVDDIPANYPDMKDAV